MARKQQKYNLEKRLQSRVNQFGYELLERRAMLSAEGIGVSPVEWVVIDSESQYDDSARLISLNEGYDTDGDGVVDTRNRDTFGYDDAGNFTSMVHDLDSNADGAWDSRTSDIYVYDDNGLQSSATEFDYDADGAIDYRATSMYAYDENGALTSITYEVDEDGDGTIDSTEVQIVSDGAGDSGDGGGGGSDDGTSDGDSYVYTEELDDQGRVISSTELYDIDNDGITDQRTDRNYVYDDAGNLASLTQSVDQDGDGVMDSRSMDSYNYDSSGNLLVATNELDNNADGALDYRAVTTNYFDENGELVSTFVEIDENGDGTIDSTFEQTQVLELPLGSENDGVQYTASGGPARGSDLGKNDSAFDAALSNAAWQLPMSSFSTDLLVDDDLPATQLAAPIAATVLQSNTNPIVDQSKGNRRANSQSSNNGSDKANPETENEVIGIEVNNFRSTPSLS